MTHPKELIDMLPKPTGFRLLIAIPKHEETSDGGILLPEQMRKREQAGSMVGYVMMLGPIAYQSEERFPNGAWCAEGDFIMFKTYAGARFSVKGQEFRLINDDMVDAIVPDPTVVERM